MIEIRLMMTKRSAPAMSAPRPNAPLTTARNEKRKSATAKDPTVRIRRTFLRKRFAKIRLRNFMQHLRPARSDASGCPRRADPFRDGVQGRRVWRRLDRG